MAGTPSAILEDDQFSGPSTGPNVEPAGSSPNLSKPSATWPNPGIIRELNAMWLHPGLLDITGTGFATKPAIQKMMMPQFPGISFGGEFSFPGLEMPEMSGGGGMGPGGGGGGGGQNPEAGPNILQLVGLAANLLSKFGGGGAAPTPGEDLGPGGGNESSGPGGAPGAQGQTGLEANYGDFNPGLLEQLQGGQLSSYDLIDPSGNLQWDRLGIDWKTNPDDIAHFFATKGIDINAPNWLEADYGLEGPHVPQGQFGLGMDTSLNSDVKLGDMTKKGGGGGINNFLSLLGPIMAAPGIPDEVKRGLSMASNVYQSASGFGSGNIGGGISSLGNIIGDIGTMAGAPPELGAAIKAGQAGYQAATGFASGGIGGISSGIGALGALGGMANTYAGGPKELSYALQDLGLVAGSFGPQAVITLPLLLANVLQQTGVTGQNPSVKWPKGFMPINNDMSMNPLTGAVLYRSGDHGKFDATDLTKQGQRASAGEFYKWNLPSPLYNQTLPSVEYLLQGLFGGSNRNQPSGYRDESGSSPWTAHNTFNEGYADKQTYFDPRMPTFGKVENPYWSALNYIGQTYLGRNATEAEYQKYAPILAKQGPQAVVNDALRSPEFQQYIAKSPSAVQYMPEYASTYVDPNDPYGYNRGGADR